MEKGSFPLLLVLHLRSVGLSRLYNLGELSHCVERMIILSLFTAMRYFLIAVFYYLRALYFLSISIWMDELL